MIIYRSAEAKDLEDRTVKRTKLIYLLVAVAVISLITFFTRYIFAINVIWLRLTLSCTANLLMGLVAFLFIKKTRMREDLGLKNKRSYLIGLITAVALHIVIGVIPALLGVSLVGGHKDFVLWSFIYQFLQYLLIIGPVEELIFRVYIQGTIVCLLPRCKWLGVVIASLLFGFWHLFNGNLIQVLFTFLIGCAFGFAKYFIKDCKFAGVALGHGLYDFLNFAATVLWIR